MKTIVVGGSGMIGYAIQKEVVKETNQDNYTFSYDKNNTQLLPKVKNIHLDLFNEESVKQLEDFSNAIYLAGNTDHALASVDPVKDVKLNVEAFLNFMKHFKGNLVLFSSQAVYYGYNGSVKEDAVQKPTIPYGISRHMAEMYAFYFKQTNKLNSLSILRPTYVFGEGEKNRRLIRRCARAAKENTVLKIFGKGQSFLNPLPVEFVAKTSVKFNEKISREDLALEVNLNSPEPMTVLELIQTLQEVKQFKYLVEDGGEEYPAKHYGDSTRLLGLLKEWKMEMPNVKSELKKYFKELIGEKML